MNQAKKDQEHHSLHTFNQFCGIFNDMTVTKCDQVGHGALHENEMNHRIGPVVNQLLT